VTHNLQGSEPARLLHVGPGMNLLGKPAETAGAENVLNKCDIAAAQGAASERLHGGGHRGGATVVDTGDKAQPAGGAPQATSDVTCRLRQHLKETRLQDIR